MEEDHGQRHNWLYSVVPGPEHAIFLVGYCKNDNKYFTVKLKNTISTPEQVLVRDVDIPKWGCYPTE